MNTPMTSSLAQAIDDLGGIQAVRRRQVKEMERQRDGAGRDDRWIWNERIADQKTRLRRADEVLTYLREVGQWRMEGMQNG